ncbi:hypothetical protein [Kitasatospora sp. MBT63]|uniref:hypothetical protein n=1 Tax=Kitasatospora sp. MBT63 TaxID=1444768 RepID=UPI00053A79FB|nr:hypothetical protein [Kitasatospora sp. MBT63]
MFRLIRTATWTATRRRLLDTEGELELGLALAERWTGYPDGSAVHYLGAGRWLHYHPGRTKLRTSRAHFFPESERICLIASRRSTWDVEPVAGLAGLLDLLGGNYIDYRAPRAGQPA